MAALLNTVGAAPARLKPSALADWISHLRILMPPVGLIHVGAGNGADLPDYAQWGMNQVVLVEADEANAKQLADWARPHPGWQVHHALVAETDGETSFHVASNRRESGLLPAESLRQIWRNLQGKSQRPMSGIHLDALLPAESSPNINWLVIDCLPAAALMGGAHKLLERCEVVLARVTMAEPNSSGSVSGSALGEADDLLKGYGLFRVSVEEERMPLLGHALFVRLPGTGRTIPATEFEVIKADLAKVRAEAEDARAKADTALAELELAHVHSKAYHDQLQVTHAELATARASEVSSLKALAEERDSSIQASDAIRSQLAEAERRLVSASELAEQERTKQSAQNSTLEAERNRLIAERGEIEVKLSQLQVLVGKMNTEKQQLDQLISDLSTQVSNRDQSLQAVMQENHGLSLAKDAMSAELIEQNNMIGQLTQERDAIASSLASTHEHAHNLEVERERFVSEIQAMREQLSDGSGQVARLTQEVANQTARWQDCQQQLSAADKARQLFDIEIAKAEAQIALIRDVLLRRADVLSPQTNGQ